MINNEKKEMRYSILKFSNRHIMNMKTKKDIVEDWLPRYTRTGLGRLFKTHHPDQL